MCNLTMLTFSKLHILDGGGNRKARADERREYACTSGTCAAAMCGENEGTMIASHRNCPPSRNAGEHQEPLGGHKNLCSHCNDL